MACSLTIRELRKVYHRQGSEPLTVLDGFDLDVPAGAIVSIVGLNGSGKTTLLRCIAGLEVPDAGSVEMSGDGAAVGMVFQELGLLPWRTVRQNIALGMELDGTPKARRREVVETFLDAFGLAAFGDAYPKELSGGMRQKVAIARTLAPEPGVVLMDEPFAALDCRTRMSMHSFLLEVWARRRDTIVFVTHDIEEAVYLGDRVVVMTQKPARVAETLVVDLPRPRDKTGSECNALRRHILDTMRRMCAGTR
ncbi:MAG: ABC transporter ATP-binding protein [Desulfovibrio sp.]|jgi:NitT/TauT family transport system ATP-binding protein|nr:ABC transporter ATP-binding protein [Desulfovibrio sp.]